MDFSSENKAGLDLCTIKGGKLFLRFLYRMSGGASFLFFAYSVRLVGGIHKFTGNENFCTINSRIFH